MSTLNMYLRIGLNCVYVLVFKIIGKLWFKKYYENTYLKYS